MEVPPFYKLLDTNQNDLYRFLLGMVGQRDVDDCFQEVVLAALRAYPKLRDDRNLKGWLFTIGYRKAMDVHRARNRRSELGGIVLEEGHDSPAFTDRDVWEAVRRLSKRQKDAILLRFWGDLDYESIASVLNCSNAAARKRVSDGIARLKKVISS